MGRDKRGQNPSAGFSGLGAPGPACQPLKPNTFAIKEASKKVHLVEAGPSRQILTLSVSEQSSRMTPKASLTPQQDQGPFAPLQDPS
jgi:hypothetical protein